MGRKTNLHPRKFDGGLTSTSTSRGGGINQWDDNWANVTTSPKLGENSTEIDRTFTTYLLPKHIHINIDGVLLHSTDQYNKYHDMTQLYKKPPAKSKYQMHL